MTVHANLTGADLHEPKGVAGAAAGRVYVSNGTGSGAWTDRYEGHLIRNLYWRDGTIPDVSTPSSKCWIYIPVQSELVKITCLLDASITTADSILSLYVNGVLFGTTLTVPQAGSVAGTLASVTVGTTNTIPAGSVIEVRSDGGATGVSVGKITLELKAK